MATAEKRARAPETLFILCINRIPSIYVLDTDCHPPKGRFPARQPDGAHWEIGDTPQISLA